MNMMKRVFIGTMKLADLIDQNPGLLKIITRFGLSFGFGEATVEEACRRAHVHPATLLLICNVYSSDEFTPTADDLRRADVRGIVDYLRTSHDFYLRTAIQALSASITQMLEPCDESRKTVIRRFFAEYKSELEKHFEYEEGTVFPTATSRRNWKTSRTSS